MIDKMTLKLDDLLVKKKEPVQILDLTKNAANSEEELRKLLERVPEYKIKMDKIKVEEMKIERVKSRLMNGSAKEEKRRCFVFADPIPHEMRSLHLEDLYSVDIQWKMLTSVRPRNKLDEEYFSKLMELGKLQLQARQEERKKSVTSYLRKTKNKAGITETKIICCRDCGEELCTNNICQMFAYDLHERFANCNLHAHVNINVDLDVDINAKIVHASTTASANAQIESIRKLVVGSHDTTRVNGGRRRKRVAKKCRRNSSKARQKNSNKTVASAIHHVGYTLSR